VPFARPLMRSVKRLRVTLKKGGDAGEEKEMQGGE
jgi:hypothetical protein